MPILRVAASSILLKGGCPECGHDMSKHMTVTGGGHACLHPDCRRAIDDGFMQRKGEKVKRGDTQCTPCYFRGVEHTESCGTCGHVKEHHHEPSQDWALTSRLKDPTCSDCVYDNVKAKREFSGGIAKHPFTPMDHLPLDIRDMDKANAVHGALTGHQYHDDAYPRGTVENVPTHEAVKYTDVAIHPGYEHEPGGCGNHKYPTNEAWGAFKDSIKEHGIGSPIQIEYCADHNRAIVGEGNHRLAAAHQLGISHVPMEVLRGHGFTCNSRRGYALRGAPRPDHDAIRPNPRDRDYVRGNMAPSDLGIPVEERKPRGLVKAHDDDYVDSHCPVCQEPYRSHTPKQSELCRSEFEGGDPKRVAPYYSWECDECGAGGTSKGYHKEIRCPNCKVRNRMAYTPVERTRVPDQLPEDIRTMKSIFVVEDPIVDVTARSLFELVVDEPRMMKDGIEKAGPGMMKLRPGEKGWMTIRGDGPMSGRPIRAEMGRGMKLRPPVERKKVEFGPDLGRREYSAEERKKIRALPHEPTHADNLLHEYTAATPAEKSRGHQWYARASKIVGTYAGQHEMPHGKKVGYSRPQIAGALAALSPRQKWPENVDMLDRAVRHHQRGGEFKRVRGLGFRPNAKKAWRILGGEEPDEVLGSKKASGKKVRAFQHALHKIPEGHHVDHADCDRAIVVDNLMDKAIHDDKKPEHRPTAIDGAVYDRHANAIRVAAMRAGVEPWALQATVWGRVNDKGQSVNGSKTYAGAGGMPNHLKLAGVWPGSKKKPELVRKSQAVWRMTSSS